MNEIKKEQKNGFYPFTIQSKDDHTDRESLCVYIKNPLDKPQDEWKRLALYKYLKRYDWLIGIPWITVDNMTMGSEPIQAVRYSDFQEGIFDEIGNGSHSNLVECYRKFHIELNERLNRDIKQRFYSFQPIDLTGLPAYAVRYFESELHIYGHTPVYIFDIDGVKHYQIVEDYEF